MENTKSDAIDGGDNPAGEDLSEAALVAAWMGEVQDPEESPETEEETEEKTTEETTEADAEEVAEEEETEEEPEAAGVDLDSLTDEQWEAVRTKLKSRAAADIQSLKRELKAKDQTIATLQVQQPQITTETEPVTSRFLKGIETPDALASKVTDLKKLGKDIERILDDHEDYGSEDPIQVGTETYTKKSLKALRKEVTEALTEAVPSKQAEFHRNTQISELLDKAKADAVVRVPELADDESEVAKNFKTVTESPMFKKAYDAAPEARPMLHLMAALAVKASLAGPSKTVKAPVTTGTKPKAKPPSSPSGVAAQPPARMNEKATRIEAARKQYEATGSSNDLVKLMALEDG